VNVHGQMGGHDILEYILGFKATLVLWEKHEIHIIFKAFLFIVLLVLLDTKFATLRPLP
jgi:hypothetical protein